MDYREALDFLESPDRFSPKLGLARIQHLLERLDDPQKEFPSILIAGTSGKSSSCKMIQSVLTRAGWRTGLLTKPHLQSYRERVSVDEQLIGKDDLVRIVERIVPQARESGRSELGDPTYFEMGVALAFLYFAERTVDLAVVEVGMGGRLDATNVLLPLICGITPVDYDHVAHLGNTLGQIASEKAGIIKPGVPVVVAPQKEEAMEVIRKKANELKAPLYQSISCKFEPISSSLEGQFFSLQSKDLRLENVFLPLLGLHQLENAAFAFTLLFLLEERGFSWREGELREAWRTLHWPGRLEVLQKEPLLLIDGAHNPEKAKAVATALAQLPPFQRLFLVLGLSDDKDLPGILSPFAKMSPLLVATQARSSRALPSKEILRIAGKMGLCGIEQKTVREAVGWALDQAEAQDLILVTGSIYVAGEARDLYVALN